MNNQKWFFGPQGWLCPRCGRVNNPSMLTCFCKPATTETVTAATNDEVSRRWDETRLMWEIKRITRTGPSSHTITYSYEP